MPPAAAGGGGPRWDLRLLGAWLYGKKSSRYEIRQTEDGGLEFEGPHTGVGTVIGNLRPRGDWFQAELKPKLDEKQGAVGTIRVRFVQEFTSVCSNFKNLKQADWGKDIYAHREDLALADGYAGPEAPQPSIKAVMPAPEKPKRERTFKQAVQVNPEEPLLLVGNCNEWNLGQAKKRFAFTMEDEEIYNGRLSYLRVEVDAQDFDFQVVSAKQGWDWRLYPPLTLKEEITEDWNESYVRAAGPDQKAASGRNFHIKKMSGWSIEVCVWICSRDNMTMFYREAYNRKKKQWKEGTEGFEKKKPPPPYPVDKVDRTVKPPKQCTFDEIGALQLVGECNKWKLDTQGLELTEEANDLGLRRREHYLRFRMQAREVDFQIVSRKLGFVWRLFPDRQGGMKLQPGRRFQVKAVLGGEDDGHNKNFILAEYYLNIVQLFVVIQEADPSDAPVTIDSVYVGYEVVNSAKPQVGISPTWIQYPPKDLCFLDDEVVNGLQVEEERNDAMDKRNKLIRDMAWALQQKYLDEQVEREILALRALFPYHEEKSTISAELEEAFRRELAAAKDTAPLYPAVDPPRSEAHGGSAAIPAPPESAEDATPGSCQPKEEADAEASGGAADCSSQGPDNVRVYICRELEIFVELQVEPNITVGQLRSLVTELDETGTVESTEFGFALPSGETLSDDTILTQEMVELDICAAGLDGERLWQDLEASSETSVNNDVAADEDTANVTTAATDGAATEQSTGCPVREGESASQADDATQHANGTAVAALGEVVLDELEELRRDMRLRLRVAVQRLEGLPTSVGSTLDEETAEGVRAAVRHLLELQEKAYTSAVRLSEQVKTAELGQNQISQRLKSTLFDTAVNGDADAQFNILVSHLPSVQQARSKAMKEYSVPKEMTNKAIYLTAERDPVDPDVCVANYLAMKRLRVAPSPHPQVMQRAAKALLNDRVFVGRPEDWYHGLDVRINLDFMAVRPDLEKVWMAGYCKQPFGGKMSGKYGILSDEDLFKGGYRRLLESAIHIKDQLRLLIAALGEQSKLRVEPRVQIGFHTQGEVLPPWVHSDESPRRLAFIFHFSSDHLKPGDGGFLHLAPHVGADTKKGRRLPTKSVAVPAAGGHWCAFYTQEWSQAVEMVKLPCGRWSMAVYAEDIALADRKRKNEQDSYTMIGKALPTETYDNFQDMLPNCACCEFSAADGVIMNCPESHRVCRECLQKEIREEGVPTCPACVKTGFTDRVYLAGNWDLFDSKSIDHLGCICPGGETVDLGSRVIICGQCKDSGLNAKLGEVICWNPNGKCWEVRVFATDQVVQVAVTCLHLAPACAAGVGLSRCPCWPTGRGIYPVSLGCRCCVKQGILEAGDAGGGVGMGWPYMHGMPHLPFDWNLTCLDGVLYFLRHEFENFFHHDDMRVVKAVNRDDVTFDNYYSSMHAFIHHSPVKDAGRIAHRFDRFRVLCNHTRETRGARPLVFIRYFHDSSEFARIDELFCLLRLWAGDKIRLCCVCMLQVKAGEEVLYRHAGNPRILIYLVAQIGVMDFAPIKQICRFATFDELGLISCQTIDPVTQLPLRQFRDPYTTTSSLCEGGDWLTDLKGKDIAFYPDCPKVCKPCQDNQNNKHLFHRVLSCDLDGVQALLKAGGGTRMRADADANCWDDVGRTPLHHLAELERCSKLGDGSARFGLKTRKRPTSEVVPIAGTLLLAKADPRCHDFKKVNCVDYARNNAASRELVALLSAAAMFEVSDSEALYRALEMLREPQRSMLSRIISVRGMRALTTAEFTWRHPPPDSEAFIEEMENTIRSLELLTEDVRKREMKRLLLEWHPDKNAHRLELATVVFQYLQAQKDRVIKR